MDKLTAYVVSAALALALAGLASLWYWGPHRFPLVVYVIAVALVWAVVLTLGWFTGGETRLSTFALVFLGYALGMFAMYIAVHVYR